MKRLLLWALSVALLLSLCACGRQNVENTDGVQSFQGADEQQKDDFSQPEDTGDARDNNSQKQSETSTIFTNDYGTRTTICAHKGCTNYIASSGDTNCCKESFNRFLIISLDVLICRYSPLLRAFPALFISEEPHKSFYYPSCFRSQK